MTDVTVVADRDRLALALDALLENAIAHTTSGDEIAVSARREGGQVVLMVADSGTGIAPADLDRIFQRFARANPQRTSEAGGFGLGLAIVQAIASAHHGAAAGCRARQAAARPSNSSCRSASRPAGPPPPPVNYPANRS